MGCCWDQGRQSDASALSSALYRAFVLVHDAVWCTPLGMRQTAGILGMPADPPFLLSCVPWTSFSPDHSCRVLGRERAEHWPARAASLAAGVGPDWAQCFLQPPPYSRSRAVCPGLSCAWANTAHTGMAQIARLELL